MDPTLCSLRAAYGVKLAAGEVTPTDFPSLHLVPFQRHLSRAETAETVFSPVYFFDEVNPFSSLGILCGISLRFAANIRCSACHGPSYRLFETRGAWRCSRETRDIFMDTASDYLPKAHRALALDVIEKNVIMKTLD